MRCSKCSEKVRPVVAFDIDGTLGDYHGHFLRFAAHWLVGDDTVKLLLDMSIHQYRGAEPFSEYCIDMLDIDLATYRQIKLAYRQAGMKRSMPMIPGAREAVTRAFMAGAEVWLTTTRPYLSLDNIVPDTVEWCKRNNIDYDGMLFDEDKYAQLAERVDPERVVAVIDDLPEMLNAADDLFPGRTIMVWGKYNRACGAVCKLPIRGAGEVAAIRSKEWIREHAS